MIIKYSCVLNFLGSIFKLCDKECDMYALVSGM